MYLLTLSFLFLNFSTFPFNPFPPRHFLVLLVFLCDNCIHFIPEIVHFFYSHMYFEWFIVITSGFIKLIVYKFSKEQHYGMHESHWHNLLACVFQVGFHITTAIITMYPIVIETWIYFRSVISEFFQNLHDWSRTNLNGIFYLPIHSLWQITFRVEPLYNVVQNIRIFSKSYSKKIQ